MSYRPGFPDHLAEATPDAKAFAAFDQVLPPFIRRIEDGYKTMVLLNGGEPNRNLFREQLMAVPTETLDPQQLDNIP
jgi:hypothetical protein